MAILMQIGIVYPQEMKSGIGHVACTLGGVNYESRGGKGVLKGSAARGATSPLFRHHFVRVFSDKEADRAKRWADQCVGQPYVWAAVPRVDPRPKKGGDCSGFMSGIICAAEGRGPVRLFGTGTWKQNFKKLGFDEGLRKSVPITGGGPGALDRPYPGTPVGLNSPKRDHVRWIQARLNFAGKGKVRLDVDGEYGPLTEKAVIAFQKSHGLQGQGMCGPKTWPLLNAIR